MRSRTRIVCATLGPFGLALAPVTAAEVAVFDDPAYVDSAEQIVFAESDNVQAALDALGYGVVTVEGVTAGDWEEHLAGAGVLLVPELEVGDLAAALDADAREEIRRFVVRGGGLIVHGFSIPRASSVLNGVFGFTLEEVFGPFDDFALSRAAEGTPFAAGPAAIPTNNGTSSLLTSTLPPGAGSMYEQAEENVSAVVRFRYGSGRIIFLGWDWFDGAPNGTQDGGWVDVLDRATQDAARGCIADVDESGDVGFGDLIALLAAWGPCPGCPEDLDASGDVGIIDLLTLLSAWGDCPDPARSVVVFDDPAFVDSNGGVTFSAESDNVQASLTKLGHGVTTFEGIAAASWESALATSPVLLIPEQESFPLGPDLSPEAIAVISEFVTDGGGMVVHGTGGRAAELINTLFGYSIEETFATPEVVFDIAAGATGTAFEGGPASIPANDATSRFLQNSLPPDAITVYGAGDKRPVIILPVGLGKVIYLGWDWWNAAPIGEQDGGWLEVLDAAIIEAAAR